MPVPLTSSSLSSEPCEGLRATGPFNIKLMLSVYILCLLFRPFEWLLISCCWGVLTWTHDPMLPKTSFFTPWPCVFRNPNLSIWSLTPVSLVSGPLTCKSLPQLTSLELINNPPASTFCAYPNSQSWPLWLYLWSIVSQTLLEHALKKWSDFQRSKISIKLYKT